MLESVAQQPGPMARFGPLAAIAGIALVALLVWALWPRLPDLAPPAAYTRSVPRADAQVDGVDLEALHRVEIGGWVLAAGAERSAARRTVLGRLHAHPALAQVTEQLMDAVDARDAAAARDAAEVYNSALRARGMPWAVKTGVATNGAYVKTYWLAGRPQIRLGDRVAPVSLMARADTLNVVEGWLGVAEELGGASVVVDRVQQFATEIVWPLLGDETHPHHPALRAVAAERLPPDALERLTHTAATRGAMVAARDAIYERRRTCGSTLGLRLSWSGLDEVGTLPLLARQDADSPCPGITAAEVDAIGWGTLTLREDPALGSALEALVAWAARHVAYHEARHALDHDDWGASMAPRCGSGSEARTDCDRLDDRALSELSAYATAFASDEAVMALVQACSVLDAGSRGSGARALKVLLPALGASCDGPVPDDLAEGALAFEAEWFERRAPAALAGDFPEALPLELTD
ncbi:MAG: hypothetical protein KTR31_14810 [Myxococcales bacterium]|nr:hypothetical protein [Myxococcales bacterium]